MDFLVAVVLFLLMQLMQLMQLSWSLVLVNGGGGQRRG